MIKSLYETHLEVRNLEESISFYEKLDIKLAHKIEERRVAFFFIGEEKQMLGLWEIGKGEEFHKGHFAFGVSLSDLENSIEWLKAKGIQPTENFFGLEPIEPVVHTWMPAASVYFRDPDGNSLEFITLLEGESIKTNEVFYLSEWKKKYRV
jgi:lactoylglutathione lyase